MQTPGFEIKKTEPNPDTHFHSLLIVTYQVAYRVSLVRVFYNTQKINGVQQSLIIQASPELVFMLERDDILCKGAG